MDTNEKFDGNALAEGANGDAVTVEQLQPENGYRLLTTDEIINIRTNPVPLASYEINMWDFNEDIWLDMGFGITLDATYRTLKPDGYFLTNYPKPIDAD